VTIQPANGASAGDVTGALDGGPIDARSRDRIVVSGWAASELGPVREVRLNVDGEEVGVVRHFMPRPEVAEQLARPDLAECGWRVMVYLPALRQGSYRLGAQAVAANGAAAELPPLELRILE
jgi:hypothetical protein